MVEITPDSVHWFRYIYHITLWPNPVKCQIIDSVTESSKDTLQSPLSQLPQRNGGHDKADEVHVYEPLANFDMTLIVLSQGTMYRIQ